MGPTFAFAWLSLACGAPERAAEMEKLATAAFAVPRDPSGQRAAAIVAAVLSERVAERARLRPIEPGRALSGDPRTREEETLSRARTALADGRRVYDALNLDEAIARLGQAVSLYQQTGPLLGDLSELATSLAYLGAALTLRGSTDEGVSTFVELLTINPGYSIEGFPPTVAKMFEKAVEKLQKAAKGSVEIYSTPPYAEVFVDGTFRGVTPLTLKDLPGGTHYLRLEANGYVIHGAPLDVTPNQQITSQTRLVSVKNGAELRDLLSRASREVPGENMGGNLRQLARLLVADAMVVVSVSQSGKDATLVGAAFDAGAATRLMTERAVLDADGPGFQRDTAAMVDKLLTAIAGDAPQPRAGGSGPDGPQSGGFGLATGGGTGTTGAGTGSTGASGATGGGTGAAGAGASVSAGSGSTVSGQAPVIGPKKEGVKPGTIAGWVMVSAGGVAAGVGIGFGILTANTHRDYLNTSQASSDLPAIRNAGKNRALVADITLIGGLALVGGGVLTLILSGRESGTPAEILGLNGAAIVPLAGGGALLSVEGSLW